MAGKGLVRSPLSAVAGRSALDSWLGYELFGSHLPAPQTGQQKAWGWQGNCVNPFPWVPGRAIQEEGLDMGCHSPSTWVPHGTAAGPWLGCVCLRSWLGRLWCLLSSGQFIGRKKADGLQYHYDINCV